MNAPTLWDRVVEAETKIREGKRPAPDAPGFLEKRLAALPRSRGTDPSTSHEAAVSVKPGNSDLIKAIRFAVQASDGPISAFDIAYSVSCGDEFRWSEATIRTAVSRAGLHAVDTLGVTPRGRRCLRYVLREGA